MMQKYKRSSYKSTTALIIKALVVLKTSAIQFRARNLLRNSQLSTSHLIRILTSLKKGSELGFDLLRLFLVEISQTRRLVANLMIILMRWGFFVMTLSNKDRPHLKKKPRLRKQVDLVELEILGGIITILKFLSKIRGWKVSKLMGLKIFQSWKKSTNFSTQRTG